MPRHKAVAEIRNLVKISEIKVRMHWIKAHIGYAYNDRTHALAKEAAICPTVDVQIHLSCRQMKRNLFGRALIDWQSRWDRYEDGWVTYTIFQIVSTQRLQGDFFVIQVLTRHGAFGHHRARFFRGNPACFCGVENSTIKHCL